MEGGALSSLKTLGLERNAQENSDSIAAPLQKTGPNTYCNKRKERRVMK
jgi:hypothetical protein